MKCYFEAYTSLTNEHMQKYANQSSSVALIGFILNYKFSRSILKNVTNLNFNFFQLIVFPKELIDRLLNSGVHYLFEIIA